ncbi:MAG: helix-turn-helix transcriptional regulator [Treponema sp.]|nr:helix-turn-helix transcriptional regulator [Spirochaetales bacterium]MDY5810764.1 helix-turn-helix transcriptional regulator [Treponema sp.]MEE1181069.1 helix-turn-helix transcriptional regulator [Treponema sp.]
MIQKVLGGVSLTAIYNWFNGKSMPCLDYFAVLSNMLNTPIDDLLVVQNQKREKV